MFIAKLILQQFSRIKLLIFQKDRILKKDLNLAQKKKLTVMRFRCNDNQVWVKAQLYLDFVLTFG
jgi:hypothetical protein